MNSIYAMSRDTAQNTPPDDGKSKLDQLLGDCEETFTRTGGPGGQKRNKTSNAVRITHRPTGISAAADTSRSQAVNRRLALERLAVKLAVQQRKPPVAPAGFAEHTPAGRLECRNSHDDFPDVLGFVLDVLAASGWPLRDAAARLGVTSASLVGFLQQEPEAMTHLNQQRHLAGLKSLGGK